MILTNDSDYWLRTISWDYFKSDPVLEDMLRHRMRKCSYICFCNVEYSLGTDRKEGIEIEIKYEKNNNLIGIKFYDA